MVNVAKPLGDWHEDDGPVVWWKFPVEEPAWIGTPLDSDWPGYHTHWTPHPVPPPWEDDVKHGVWFVAACSGLRYRDRSAAGDVKAIIINGEYFKIEDPELASENQKLRGILSNIPDSMKRKAAGLVQVDALLDR